ncbi:DUF6442 family protein [Enterococcus sp. BWR-S5]|uniref:DUF6442 family protein n=1 Tax=Enterococcus sp. BWR-S5 TaxID=2787714 RepID=UPI0019215CBD|nr:DUF6442 family protein [Enterococcus sp. BWR-S5]MBL1223620.1 hypothetical protein [Enterococcus sp. BWR-S5]
MDKEELLQRARNSKNGEKDGIEQQQMLEGARYGALVFSVLMVVLMLYTLVKWRITELTLVLAITWLYFPAAMYGMSRLADKKERPTKTMVVCFIAGIALLISYFVKSW